jgi:hypothetical protein
LGGPSSPRRCRATRRSLDSTADFVRHELGVPVRLFGVVEDEMSSGLEGRARATKERSYDGRKW